jgi:hypothetical protein
MSTTKAIKDALEHLTELEARTLNLSDRDRHFIGLSIKEIRERLEPIAGLAELATGTVRVSDG